MPTQSTQIFLGSTPIPIYYLGDTQVGINPASVTIPPNGLIYAFDATNPLSYPGSGSIWYDLSPNKIWASTFQGSSAPTYNSVNKEFNFNGTNTALMAPLSSSIATGSAIRDFTQIFWVKVANGNPDTANGVVNLEYGNNISLTFDAISYNGQTDVWRLTSDNNNRNVTSTVTQTEFNTYYMITSTRTAGSFNILKNGATNIANGSFNPTIYTTATFDPLYSSIGNRVYNTVTSAWASDGWFTGSLSSVLLYNRVLSTAEINQIYNVGRTGIVI